MKKNTVYITGTLGIESQNKAKVSLSNSLRTPSQTVTGVSKRPIDTLTANENSFCAPVDEKLAADLFDKWNAALKTRNPKAVAALYAEDAVLLPTVSNLARTNLAEIEDYFAHFLEKSPVGTIVQRNVKKGCNKITDAGIYSFRLTDMTGTKEVPARYTFVYEFRDNGWKIVHHHSSVMPE
ncbi:SgcJ/EcaC family oxidoreductase [Thiomicrospira sp.]|uniref:SgcJ/EcaC family oxidoreductase n=1 Tax=Thiomicrospira sp. TaxID=935 RepID=UPI002F92F7C1